jgi:hypothetical protein
VLLPSFPALERFAINAFKYESLDSTPIGEEAADAVFMRALGARAPALTHLRLLVRMRDISYQPCTTIRWSDLLAFVASCRRGTRTDTLRLRVVTVSLELHSLDDVPDPHAALDITEREALASGPLADEVRALPGMPRLFLHAHFAGVDENEGPVREIFNGLEDTTNPQ